MLKRLDALSPDTRMWIVVGMWVVALTTSLTTIIVGGLIGAGLCVLTTVIAVYFAYFRWRNG